MERYLISLKKRKIAVITGTRAEYGLLCTIIKGIHEDPDLELQLIVTGTHLSPEFGMTVDDIVRDGFPVAERVEILLSSDTDVAVATSMGLGMIRFADVFERLKPDIVVILGDRFEIMSVAAVAVALRIVIAHIHGGERTEGAIDEMFRHAITKMSHIHFPVTQEYADRVERMGEKPEHIFNCGAPGLDNIKNLKLLDRNELAKELDIPANKDWGMVTYHPVTAEAGSTEKEIRELLLALDNLDDIYWVFTMPNADMGNNSIIRGLKVFIENHDNAKMFKSLGQLRYLSLMKNATIAVGNSSSGIIESASFELPTINIGNRQKGRIRPANVIDVQNCTRKNILETINKGLSKEYRKSLRGMDNIYGMGNAGARIVDTLKAISIENLFMKQFHETTVAGGV